MALTITQQNNTIILEGILNAANVNNFKTHFGFIQTESNNLTLNLTKVTNIDASAMIELKAIYKNAILNQNIFSVKGLRSEELNDAFKYQNVA